MEKYIITQSAKGGDNYYQKNSTNKLVSLLNSHFWS